MDWYNWGTAAVTAGTVGLALSTFLTARSSLKAAKAALRRAQDKTHMQIVVETKAGDLVDVIELDSIDEEVPKKLERALEAIKKTKQEAATT